jgi:hypothetical protein
MGTTSEQDKAVKQERVIYGVILLALGLGAFYLITKIK